jgi:hypothetical protein
MMPAAPAAAAAAPARTLPHAHRGPCCCRLLVSAQAGAVGTQGAIASAVQAAPSTLAVVQPGWRMYTSHMLAMQLGQAVGELVRILPVGPKMPGALHAAAC